MSDCADQLEHEATADWPVVCGICDSTVWESDCEIEEETDRHVCGNCIRIQETRAQVAEAVRAYQRSKENRQFISLAIMFVISVFAWMGLFELIFGW